MPGWFSGLDYAQPERIDPSDARARRFATSITKSRQELEARSGPLSPVNNFHLNRLKEFEIKFGSELDARVRRVEQLRKRNLSLKSPEYKSAISRLFQLQQRRSALLERASQERRANQFKKSFVDRRYFDPTKTRRGPSTVFGTNAWLRASADAVSRRLFRSPNLSIPCIQRAVRREVLFASRKAGRGYHGRRRKSPFHHIGC